MSFQTGSDMQLVNQIHVPHDGLLIRQILARVRHDGCGSRAEKAGC